MLLHERYVCYLQLLAGLLAICPQVSPFICSASNELGVYVHVLSHFSHIRLFALLYIIAHQVPLSMGIQARILEWGAMPSSKGTSRPRDLTLISCFNRWILDHKRHLGSPQWTLEPFKSLLGKMIIQWTGLFLFFIFRAADCYYWSNQYIFCYFPNDSYSVGLCYFFFLLQLLYFPGFVYFSCVYSGLYLSFWRFP